jgi:hypothetical protein
MNYSCFIWLKFKQLPALTAEGFEMLVSCARRLNDFSDVSSNLAPV